MPATRKVYRLCTAVEEPGEHAHNAGWTDVYWQYYADGSGYVMDTFRTDEIEKEFIPAERIDNLIKQAGETITAVMMMQSEGFEVPYGLVHAVRALQDAYLAAGGKP